MDDLRDKIATDTRILGPQPGPQTDFLETKADIAIYGGAAGGGKSYALLLEPLRHYHNPLFGAVIFRRNTVQVRNEGGLWDESMPLYAAVNGHPREAFLEWTFPSGSRVKFSHLEYDDTVYDWQGSQIPLICFDELTHFTEKQFLYMLSRNRSVSGVPGYIRATTNPDCDSWVRKLIAWWIGPDGLPIKARSGKLRWFIRVNNEYKWADSKDEIHKKFGKGVEIQPKSLTFIPSSLKDNKVLMTNDPNYYANLLALNYVDRARLLDGNWDVRETAGNFFRRDWFQVIDEMPKEIQKTIRFWDRAATKPSVSNPDPDWTRGLKLVMLTNGLYVVAHLASDRDTPHNINGLIKYTASQDGYNCIQMCQQDPGSAGKEEIDNFYKLLAGHQVRSQTFFKDKVTRAKAVSAAAQAGNIKVLRGNWNDDFFYEVENFPPLNGKGHDDIVDCLSGAYNEVTGSPILNMNTVNKMGRLLGGG